MWTLLLARLPGSASSSPIDGIALIESNGKMSHVLFLFNRPSSLACSLGRGRRLETSRERETERETGEVGSHKSNGSTRLGSDLIRFNCSSLRFTLLLFSLT